MIESVVRDVVDSAVSLAIRGVTGSASDTPAALDIRASVGTSTSPTSTGAKAVTGVGFQPKVVLPFSQWGASTGATTIATMGLGAAVSTSSRAAIAVSSLSGVTTSGTHRLHTNSKLITDCYNGNANEAADLTSFDADGFTLNWSPAVVSANIINHICLGGADLEVSLVQCQMNGTNAAQSFAHGLSGAPTGVLFFSAVNDQLPPNTATATNMSIGVIAGSNKFGIGVFSAVGQTTTLCRRVLSASRVLSFFDGNGAIVRAMDVSSVDATNVNVTYPVTVSTYTSYFWMLCIRGAKCQVGTFDCNGSTSPLTINTTGIRPKLFLPVFVPGDNAGIANNLGNVQSSLYMTIGASDGTGNVSCGITDQNAVTTTNARRYQSSTSLVEYNLAGTKVFEGTAAMGASSVVLTPTTIANTSYGMGGYLVIGS